MGRYYETRCYCSVVRLHLCGGQSLGTVISKDHSYNPEGSKDANSSIQIT